ncbi:peptidoglycan-binding protein [Streptomyces sp. ME02-7008A-1]|uniref:peptidoglycan-binding protein n=1 Tax=unclassified Streptomyces TaxID=2593676 RepID=UPI0029AF67CB|nr:MULTISPECIES: peptidoglycan-binding protein [unclassified Streptomyces]MDX3183473.1 peptidoglycan-binding protein [Streptomyces sp. ME02-7008A-1]MDX3303925.1 peptidoglycan-binding protein [Streptomyces sp. ME02-7008A]
MPDLWMPNATRLDIGDHAPTDGGPAKAIAHITWDRNATAAKPAALVPYENLRDYFGKNSAGRAAAPHVLWDPFTGRVTQFLPASSRSKSLADRAGGTRTNRAGSVVIQVEALFFPYCKVDGKVYARLVDTPCKGWAELNAWIRSWGVPDTWPMGTPKDFVGRRNETTWRTKAGWYRHADVPENDHQDPGSWPAFVQSSGGGTKPATPAKPKCEPYPGASFFLNGTRPALGKKSPIFTAMGKRLVAVGCGKYVVGPGPELGKADVDSYEAWQRKCGYTGTAAKWPPGKTTWDKLQVPK